VSAELGPPRILCRLLFAIARTLCADRWANERQRRPLGFGAVGRQTRL